MATPLSNPGAPPASATAAVLVQSSGMPEGSQKVEELDFNKFSGRPITVDDLVGGMDHMGFQASSIGEAVRIINDMVGESFTFDLFPVPLANINSEAGVTLKLPRKPLYF